MTEWANIKDLLLEVEQLFLRTDDVKDIEDVEKMAREISAHHGSRRAEAANRIKSLTAKMSVKEAEMAAPTEAEHVANLKTLVERKESLQKGIQQLRDDVDDKKENIRKLHDVESSLKNKMKEYEASIQLQDTRVMYANSLYSKITHIQWNYEAPPQVLAGAVMVDATAEIKSFAINKAADKFAIASQLWEAIGESIASSVAQ